MTQLPNILTIAPDAIWLPSERLNTDTDLSSLHLCVSRLPFGPRLGELGAPPDSRYARLDAEFEAALIEAVPLRVEDVNAAPMFSGVYTVYHRGRLVYVGSTLNLRVRLGQHAKSVTQAKRIDTSDIRFRFADCSDGSAVKCIEDRLIRYYGPVWNGLGFGRRPGKSADRLRHSRWDLEYDRILPVGGMRSAVLPQNDDPLNF